LLYTLVPIFITLFLYISVCCSLTWISNFLRVLYWWTWELCSKNWQYFLIKQVISNIYTEAKVKIFSSLNNCLQDVLELTQTIDLITLFCILNILILNSKFVDCDSLTVSERLRTRTVKVFCVCYHTICRCCAHVQLLSTIISFRMHIPTHPPLKVSNPFLKIRHSAQRHQPAAYFPLF